MRGNKICAEKQVTNAGPQRSESGLSLNMLPGDAMYGRKEEGASRRADQVIFPLHDSNLMPETRIRPTAHALSGLWSAVSKSIATKLGGFAEVAKESDLGTITAIPYSRLSWVKGVIPLRAYGMFFQPETVDVIARYSSSSRIKAFIQEGFDA